MPEWSWPLYNYAHLAGRILFGSLFLGAGLAHFMKLDAMGGAAAARGVPAPTVMTVGTGLMILVGGVTVLLGWHRFIGAGLLVLFLVSTAFLMHPFWKEQDPTARMNEMAHFQKDLALAGAALLLAYYAGWPWPFSLGG